MDYLQPKIMSSVPYNPSNNTSKPQTGERWGMDGENLNDTLRLKTTTKRNIQMDKYGMILSDKFFVSFIKSCEHKVEKITTQFKLLEMF